MPTWEDLLQGYVGLAKHFVCTSCLNHIFGGSTGLWGQKVILPKVAPARAINDGKGHAIAFQCSDCVTANREPIVYPLIHPNGEIVDHFNISTLQDASDQTEIKRAFGDYDNRKEREEMKKQAEIKAIKIEPAVIKIEDSIQPKQLVKEGDANYKFSKDEETHVGVRDGLMKKVVKEVEEDI